MNYYIQGNKDKAAEIKAAFEAKGFECPWEDELGDVQYINVSVIADDCAYVDPIMGGLHLLNVLKTHPDYKELELPVEPKFNVGDWLVYKNGNCFAGGLTEAQVVKVKDGVYFFASGTSGSFKFIDENCRLWAIEDAKDGDVLFSLDSKQPFIYKERPQFSQAIGYCCINKFGEFGVWNTSKCVICTDKYVPATKEQRDLLFKKMQEAGYEWDADKKELKKILKYYDISSFYAGMPVLVRADNNCRWDYSVFSRITGNKDWPFAVCNGVSFTQCIPFEGNEHLLGTANMCNKQYINW